MPELEDRELAADPNATHGASDGHAIQGTQIVQDSVTLC
jgi:hypothetical protein